MEWIDSRNVFVQQTWLRDHLVLRVNGIQQIVQITLVRMRFLIVIS